jgi:hypothetical protein
VGETDWSTFRNLSKLLGQFSGNPEVPSLMAMQQYTTHAMVDSLSFVQSMTKKQTPHSNMTVTEVTKKTARYTLSTHAHYG